MSLWINILLFLLSLVLSIVSSLVLSRELDKIGTSLQFSEGLLGIVTALGADAPEIATAISALISGNHDLGVGVVLGSNLFNLAALLGLSAIIAGRIRIRRQGVLLNGGVALFSTIIVATLLFGWIQPLVCGVLLGVLFLPYVVLLALHPQQVKLLTLSSPVEQFLNIALSSVSEDSRKDQQAPKANIYDVLTVVPALVSIVLASIEMVNTTTTLGATWHLPHVIIGIFILAMLTGIPNLLAALRLALRRRSSAVVSESLNSNTLNLISGIFLPAIVLGLGTLSGSTLFALWWLLGMTLMVIALACFQGGLSRWNGILVIVLYLLFSGILIFGRWK